MIHTFVKGTTEKPTGFEINVGNESVKIFQELVQRACDKWPDAPAEVKHFADVITNGKPMQDYLSNPRLSGPIKPNNSDKA